MERGLFLFGALLIVAGLALLLMGALFSLGGLPGDIVVRRGNFTLYIPIGTSIALSVFLSLLLTFILWLVRRL